jgi:hypothetical protein
MPRSAVLLTTALAVLSACHGDGPLAAVLTGSTHLEISVQPAVARVGSPLEVQPVVAVRDYRGHLVRDTIPVTVNLSAGDGQVLGTLTVAAKNGIARFTDLRLSGSYGPKTLTFTAPGLTDVTATTVGLRPPIRSLEDRVDDLTGPQVHVIYVVPLGASDRKLDTELDIANSVGVFQTWLSRATGLQIRFDRYEGVVDVSFFALAQSDSQMRSLGPYIVSEIESELTAAGLIRPDKRYLVYYDGGSASVCGGAAWPPWPAKRPRCTSVPATEDRSRSSRTTLRDTGSLRLCTTSFIRWEWFRWRRRTRRVTTPLMCLSPMTSCTEVVRVRGSPQRSM